MHPRSHPVPRSAANGAITYVCLRCRWPWYLCGCIGGCAAPVAPPAMIQKIPGGRWIIGNPPSFQSPAPGPVSPPPPPPRIVAELDGADREEILEMRRLHMVSLLCWGCGLAIGTNPCACDHSMMMDAS